MAETYHPRGELVDGYRVREHPLYVSWADMKSRCNDPKQAGWENYGGRGIGYCEDWKHFANFARDMSPKPSPDATMERSDNEKDYGPDNCIWASRTDQCHNRRKFKNNTTGFTGVTVATAGTFNARFDHERIRYELGNFDTLAKAVAVREAFAAGFLAGDPSVLSMLIRRPRSDSVTGIPGVNKSPSGFIVRKTVGGVRKYLGTVATVEAAKTLMNQVVS